MNIRAAANEDLNFLCQYDMHITKEELINSILLNRIYIAEENEAVIGWLRYNLFWDNTPFMNMLYILEEHRKKGCGENIVQYWEKQMKSHNYSYVMTSTASDEYAQHFYVKLGYRAVGGFTFRNEPYEIILMKEL